MRMNLRVSFNIDLQLIHEVAVLYMYDNDYPSKEDFKSFLRLQLHNHGVEACGMHSENGYCDYTIDHINKTNQFILDHLNEYSNGVVRVYSDYDEDKNYQIVFSKFCWENRGSNE